MGSLSGKGVDFHPWVQKSILTNDMVCDQQWDVDRIFLTYIANLG